jgi:hypothetical protein
LQLLEAKQQNEIVARCRERVVSHQRGPMYWLRTLTKTYNFHWRDQGLQPMAPFPYKPFPEWWTQARLDALPFEHDFTLEDTPDYLDVVMGYSLSTKRLCVPKSREMMTSWLVVGYITWECQFFEAIEWLSQSEKDDKAQGLIQYSGYLYTNQEPWLKARFPLVGVKQEANKHEIEWAHHSKHVAVPQGQRQVASHHPTGYFNDESAHQPAYKATINIVQPVAKQIICVSSAAYSDFGLECTEPA